MSKFVYFAFYVGLFVVFASCGSSDVSVDNESSSDGENSDITETKDTDIPLDEDIEETENSDDDSIQSSDPCSGDPCKDVAYSDGTCVENGDDFICECIESYEWNNDLESVWSQLRNVMIHHFVQRLNFLEGLEL